MVFFIGLVLALVCAWLICQFIRKFWKPFFARFIPKLCKVMMWTTLVLSVFIVVFVVFVVVSSTYCYTKDYVCRRDFLETNHYLPSDLLPQIGEHGVKKVWRRWFGDEASYKDQYTMAKEQEALAREKLLGTFKDPIDYQFYASNPSFWKRVGWKLIRKYNAYKTYRERDF